MMRSKMSIRLALTVFALAIGLANLAKAGPVNLVADGGFEGTQADLNASWTQIPGYSTPDLRTDPTFAHTGNNSADFHIYGVLLSQNITTIVGHTYDLNFWLRSTGPSTGALLVLFGSGGDSGRLDIGFGSTFPYTEYSLTNTASSATVTLLFQGEGLEAPDAPSVLLDDVSVTDTTVAAVPEPSTFIAAGIGIVGIFALRRRRRSA